MSDERVFMISDGERMALVNYLMERPYKEVAQGVQMLLALPRRVDYVDTQSIQSSGEENSHSS